MGELKREKRRLYTIQIKDENDQVDPQIVRREKIDGKTILTPVDGLEGKFEKVELSTYHSESLGKEVENINIFLYDDEGDYKLSTAWTSIGRSILNSLAGPEKLGKLTFGVYSKEYEGREYARIWIKNDGERADWKLKPEEQKELVKIIETSKGKIYDYIDLENKLKEMIPEINAKAQKRILKIEDIEIEEEKPLPF